MEMTRILEIPETLQAPVALAQQTHSALLTALAFTFFGLVLVIHTRLKRQAQERQSAESQKTLATLTQHAGAMQSAMSDIDRSLQRLTQRIDQLQLTQGSKEGFQQAMHLTQDGASTKQLVELCGLTHGEAELFQRLHS